MRYFPTRNQMRAFRQFFCVVPVMLTAVFWGGCPSPPPPPPVPVVSSPAPVPAVAPIDDIPADVSPAVRSHLIKLREMRDLGQISDGDYQSRKAAFLNR